MLNYPRPCLKCAKQDDCNKINACKRYEMWVRTWWKWFNGRLQERKAREKNRVYFCYAHPDETRRYLMTSPCKGCAMEKDCETPCKKYLRWYDARMEIVRKKVQG